MFGFGNKKDQKDEAAKLKAHEQMLRQARESNADFRNAKDINLRAVDRLHAYSQKNPPLASQGDDSAVLTPDMNVNVAKTPTSNDPGRETITPSLNRSNRAEVLSSHVISPEDPVQRPTLAPNSENAGIPPTENVSSKNIGEEPISHLSENDIDSFESNGVNILSSGAHRTDAEIKEKVLAEPVSHSPTVTAEEVAAFVEKQERMNARSVPQNEDTIERPEVDVPNADIPGNVDDSVAFEPAIRDTAVFQDVRAQQTAVGNPLAETEEVYEHVDSSVTTGEKSLENHEIPNIQKNTIGDPSVPESALKNISTQPIRYPFPGEKRIVTETQKNGGQSQKNVETARGGSDLSRVGMKQEQHSAEVSERPKQAFNTPFQGFAANASAVNRLSDTVSTPVTSFEETSGIQRNSTAAMQEVLVPQNDLRNALVMPEPQRQTTGTMNVPPGPVEEIKNSFSEPPVAQNSSANNTNGIRPPVNAPVPSAADVAKVAPAQKAMPPKQTWVRTYRDDLKRGMKEQGPGIVSAIITQEAEKKRLKKESRVTAPKNMSFIFLAILFFAASIGLLYYIFVMNRPHLTNALPLPESFMTTEASTTVVLDGSRTSKDVRGDLAKAESETLAPNSVKQIYFLEELMLQTPKGMKVSKNYATASHVFTALGATIPTNLQTALSDRFMFGIYRGSDTMNHPFIILKTSHYENAFNGMIAWEKTLPEQFETWFGLRATSTPVTTAPMVSASGTVAFGATSTSHIGNSTSTASSTSISTSTAMTLTPREVATSTGTSTSKTATSTSTATSTASMTLTFQSEIINNKNVRVLKTNSGTVVLLYSFRDENTIVITDSEDALEAIFERLNSAQ